MMRCAVCGAGMTFAQLFRMTRERLLVANDAALRGHLTEFKDHDLLQTRSDSLPQSFLARKNTVRSVLAVASAQHVIWHQQDA